MDSNVKRIIANFKSYAKELTVTRVVDYDKEHWIVEAKVDPRDEDEIDCFYGVNKSDYKVVTFYPSLDFQKFFDALEKRTIYTR